MYSHPSSAPTFFPSTSDGTAAVPIRCAESGVASAAQTPPCTVIQLFKDAVRAKGDKEALAVERPVPALVGRKAPPALPLSQWRKWTFRQYYNDAYALSHRKG